ncbi:helix-turn-helix domain-containing protein [Thermoproteota archaeon]
MNLIEALYFTKKHFHFTNEKLADYLGISKQELSHILAGHKGINALTLKRISQILRISMDELMDNKFVLPFYHFSKHIYSLYSRAAKSYPQFFIEEGDYLYTRPFIDGPDKQGQLVLIYDAKQKSYELERYESNFNELLASGRVVHFHVVGKSSILYQPFEDVEFQRKLAEYGQKHQKRRGRPIKT